MAETLPLPGDFDVAPAPAPPPAGIAEGSAPLEVEAGVAAFVADLRDLRARAGAPSYAALARRTGLPRSTIYDGLHRAALPNLDLTLALVHAFHGDEVSWQQRWTALRSQLDAPEQPVASWQPQPRDAQSQWYSRRFWLITAAVVVLVALAASALTVTFVRRPSGSGCQHSTMYRVTADGNLLDASDHVVAVLSAGDLFVVGKRDTGPYAHRLFGTSESTGRPGYVDEAKIARLRQTCTAGHG